MIVRSVMQRHWCYGDHHAVDRSASKLCDLDVWTRKAIEGRVPMLVAVGKDQYL